MAHISRSGWVQYYTPNSTGRVSLLAPKAPPVAPIFDDGRPIPRRQLIQSLDGGALPDATNFWDALHEFVQPAKELHLPRRIERIHFAFDDLFEVSVIFFLG